MDTERGLSPGKTVDLQLETDAHRIVARGRVLRCAVVQLHASRIIYRSAIAFDRHLPWFIDDDGYTVPAIGRRVGREKRAGATHTAL